MLDQAPPQGVQEGAEAGCRRPFERAGGDLRPTLTRRVFDSVVITSHPVGWLCDCARVVMRRPQMQGGPFLSIRMLMFSGSMNVLLCCEHWRIAVPITLCLVVAGWGAKTLLLEL